MPYNGVVAIAKQHKAEILHRISAGEPITDIAHSLGYDSHAGIIERLGDDPDYQAALRAGLVGKLEKREKDLEIASENVTVTRADRLLGHARWWAERLDPARFGQATKLTGPDGGPIQVQVVRFGAVIDGESCPQPDVQLLPNK